MVRMDVDDVLRLFDFGTVVVFCTYHCFCPILELMFFSINGFVLLLIGEVGHEV